MISVTHAIHHIIEFGFAGGKVWERERGHSPSGLDVSIGIKGIRSSIRHCTDRKPVQKCNAQKSNIPRCTGILHHRYVV